MTIERRLTESLGNRIAKAVSYGVRISFLKQQAIELAEQIRKRTRLGFGVNKARQAFELAPLRPRTIAHREEFRRNLDPLSSPKRSHITATGQLLDSLRGSAQKNAIIVTAIENRKVELDGRISRVTHAKMIEGLESGRLGKSRGRPRPFFKVSDAEKNGLLRAIRKQVIIGLNL